MKRLRRRLAWLLVRLAERIDPDWYRETIEQRRSGLVSGNYDPLSSRFQNHHPLWKCNAASCPTCRPSGATGDTSYVNITGLSPKRSA